MNPKESLTLSEFAKELGWPVSAVYKRIRNGFFEFRKEVLVPGTKRVILIPKEELEKAKKVNYVQRARPVFRGSYKTKGKMAELELPENTPEDLNLEFLDNFVIETGPVPFKAWVAAIAMLKERKSFEDIEIATGIKKNALIRFVDELKEARATEPKKFPTVIAYLNAGRPYSRANKNMLS